MQSFIVSVALIITSIFFLDILVMALGVNFSRVMTFRGWIVEQSLCLWVAALENYRLVYSRLLRKIFPYNWCRQTNKGKGSVQLFGSFVKYAC